MEIEFASPFGEEYEALLPRYRKIAEEAFRLLRTPSDYEIDVSLVDEGRIREINRDYRGKDSVTDVISFAFDEGEDPVSESYLPGASQMLGEILICLPRAKEQALEIGNSIGRELCFLFAHGLLHLLGFDHMEEEEAKEMFAMQEKVLAVLGGDYGTY